MLLARILNVVFVIDFEATHTLQRMDHLVIAHVILDWPPKVGSNSNYINAILSKGHEVLCLEE